LVKIVTDSTSDLTDEIKEKLGITVVPLFINPRRLPRAPGFFAIYQVSENLYLAFLTLAFFSFMGWPQQRIS
jgi:hypothetical protein